MRSLIAEDQAKRGDCAAALKTLASFETPPRRDREAHQLARAAASGGRIDEAARFVDTISGPSKVTALTMLAIARKKLGANPESTAAAEIRRLAAAATGDERARLLVNLG